MHAILYQCNMVLIFRKMILAFNLILKHHMLADLLQYVALILQINHSMDLTGT